MAPQRGARLTGRQPADRGRVSSAPPQLALDPLGFTALRAAALRAARGHRGDPAAADFLSDLERRCLELERNLDGRAWRPAPARAFRITDPKPRLISEVPFADRVVHHAIVAATSPRWEELAVGSSYACRAGKGVHRAVTRVRGLARPHPWFLKLDVRHFFETVDHSGLHLLIDRTVADARLRALLGVIVAEGAPAPGRGLPIGSLVSQHLANLVLGQVDRYALRTLRVGGWIRYMDDMLAFGPDRDTIATWEESITGFVTARLRQQIKPEATRRGPVHAGIPFLGFRVWPTTVRLDGARRRRLLHRLRLHRQMLAAGTDAAAVQRRTTSALGHAGHAATRGLVGSAGHDGTGHAR